MQSLCDAYEQDACSSYIKNGYNVGKYISVERRLEQTKDRYYEALQEAGAGWYEGESDSVPFIRYMVEVILACYTEFEECVGLMTASGSAGTAYDIVKRYTLKGSESLEALMSFPTVRVSVGRWLFRPSRGSLRKEP